MPNRLITEQSPYLLQHAHNPVDWYPWGDEAFQRAKEEHKPVIVSIGYAACHWCHVMERESFENADTAAYMNEHFICIKVDREEHPDVDHMYMDAVQAISGSGGWPLNVFVTPDRVPFYGGTYYPPRPAYQRPSWMQLMQRMTDVWQNQYHEVQQQAEQMINHLRQAASAISAGHVQAPGRDLCDTIAGNLLQQADEEWGGFGNAPKFPGTMAISYLLEHYHFTQHEPSLRHALRSLDAMADGGIYDQLGGGFARYSTDRQWLAPHFEKMLYDNALLMLSYSDAYAVTRNDRYKTIIEETITFVDRELKDPAGVFYCALDADSEGEEGKFYTWTWQEWNEVLGGPEPAVAAFFGVTEHGNWEHTNILHISRNIASVAEEFKMSEPDLLLQVNWVKERLLAARRQRIRPLTDDKCLLSWNALMNLALVRAAVVLDSPEYLRNASAHMERVMALFKPGDDLMHAWKGGTARITAKLDDIAYLVQAQLQLAAATGDNKWALDAVNIMEAAIRDFSQEDLFFYYTSVRQTDIPVRKVDLYDGATPSANAVMAHNLCLCGMIAERHEWIERAEGMLRAMSGTAARYAYSFGYWSLLLQRMVRGMKTVVFSGGAAAQAWRSFNKVFLPQSFALLLTLDNAFLPLLENKFSEDNLHIFVCSAEACLPPAHTLEQAIGQINE